VLRLKGFVALDDGSAVLIQVAGRDIAITRLSEMPAGESRIVAIGLSDLLDPGDLNRMAPSGTTPDL